MSRLVPCQDCGHAISPSAKACPHCGTAVKPRTKKSSWVITGLAASVLAYGLYSAQGRDDPNAPSSADDAARACEALKRSGASACRYDLHLTEPSSIEATFAQPLDGPDEMCAQVAGQIRSISAALSSTPDRWELRLFTHIGARPVASCRI